MTTNDDVRRAWREWLPTLDKYDRAILYTTRDDESPAGDSAAVPGASGPNALIIHAPESLPSSPRRAGKRRDSIPAVHIQRDGVSEWAQLGNDEAAIRTVLTAAAAESGYTVDEILTPTPRGRLNADENNRRSALADIVASLRKRGAKLEAIGAVIGRSKARVHELAASGKPNF